MPDDNTHTQRELTIQEVFRVANEIRAEGVSDTLHLEEMENRLFDISRTPAEPKAGDWEKELDSYQQRVMCDPLYGYIGRDELIRQTFGYTRSILRRALSSAAIATTNEVSTSDKLVDAPRITEEMVEDAIIEWDKWEQVSPYERLQLARKLAALLRQQGPQRSEDQQGAVNEQD